MAEHLTGQPEGSTSQLPLRGRWGGTLDWSSCPSMAGLRNRQPHMHMAFSGWCPSYLNGIGAVESPTNQTN